MTSHTKVFNFCNLRELNFQKSKISSYLTVYITYLKEITDLSKGDYIVHYLLLFFPLTYTLVEKCSFPL